MQARRIVSGAAAAAFFFLACLAAGPAPAAEPPPQTALCTTCHGKDGVGLTPDAPHIAGQPAMYLQSQLRAFRNGTRKHEVMAVIAKMLSDEDIAALAAWYSSVKLEVRLP